MAEFLIFGGTTEGRELAEFCAKMQISAVVSVATGQGARFVPNGTEVHCGRMDAMQMQEFLETRRFFAVIDATHPYAREATANIRKACTVCGVPYFRLIRKDTDIWGETVSDMNLLIRALNAFDGVILSTLGSKSLEALTQVRGYESRVWVRVLPAPEIAEYCEDLGYDRAHVIAEMPPFSLEDNLRHIRSSGAGLLVTKESGAVGGYPEKAEASLNSGIRMITLLRPQEDGFSLAEIKKLLREGEI